MKRTIFSWMTLFFVPLLSAQVGIGTLNPHSSAILHLESTTRGLLIPRLTMDQRDAIASPVAGLMVFQTDNTPGFYYYNGTSWVAFSSDNDWLINGSNISNANDGFVGIGTASPSVLLHISWANNGEITAFDDGFEDGTIPPFQSVAPAWTVTSSIAADGSYSAQSADIDNSQTSTISLDVNIPSGGSAFSFYYKVSSEANYDFLAFYIDGNLEEKWSGDVDWTQYSGNLDAGNHTLEWRYEKDGSVSSNDDKAWIDQVHIDQILIPHPLFRLEDGHQGNGKVLISDSEGNATWQDAVESGVSLWVKNGDDIYNANTGKVGVGTGSPGYKLHVKDNAAGSAVLYVENLSGDQYSLGIYGKVGASSSFRTAGVMGYQPGDYAIGVLGEYGIWGAAVAGIGWGTSVTDIPVDTDIGVYGAANFDEVSTGIYGYDPDSDEGYAGYFDGNFASTGTKSASVPTSQGNQLVYSMESPEIWFEDFGTGRLSNGEAHIRLDKMFLETVFIDSEHPMHIFVQEQGESNGLYVIPDTDGRGFTVKEKNGGTSSIPFSYRIVAKRRFYQDHRFGTDMMQPLDNNLEKASYHPPFSTGLNEARRKWEEHLRRKKHLSRTHSMIPDKPDSNAAPTKNINK